MIIEIRRAGFVNKGAELMLYSVLHQMREAYPRACFAMAMNEEASPYEKRAELGLWQKAWLWRYRLQLGDLACLAPEKVRRKFGVVLDREIDVVLDAAGFAYSDQWGDRHSVELADACRRWQKNGTKIILLPQAFGPFTSRKIKAAINSVADRADLIFAREPVSYQHLIDVAGQRPNIRMAPDFTNLMEGILPDDFDAATNRFCLIPNYRMIDKTDAGQSKAYLPFMIKCAQYLLSKDQQPFILIHEGVGDPMLAEQINEATGGNLPIIKESHPLKIKGIIGACTGVIGSRFHGLVSALSQGVPSLATGWSHKYRMLFEDYGFSRGLMDVTMSREEIHQRIDLITDPQAQKEIRRSLLDHSQKLKASSRKMWQDVFTSISNQEATLWTRAATTK